MTLEEYFAAGPPFERPIFEAVHSVVSTFGPVHVEPVSVGIFIKKAGSYLELRPMTKWVALWFPLGRTVRHPRIARKPIVAGVRVFHVVNVRAPADVTPDIEAWLAESYAFVD
jgi:hypothetical protein